MGSNEIVPSAGSPSRAFCPSYAQDKGIDALKNAGFPDRSWTSVLVTDPDNPDKPFVQKDGEFAGFFISKTTLQNKGRPMTDVRRYVDSTQIPYLVFPGAFFKRKGTGDLGDLGMVINLDNGKDSPFIVADAGPLDAELGEVSIRLAENLGGVNVNPRNGAGMPRGRFAHIVFPRSKSDPARPVTSAQLDERARALLSGIGGWARARDCISAR